MLQLTFYGSLTKKSGNLHVPSNVFIESNAIKIVGHRLFALDNGIFAYYLYFSTVFQNIHIHN